MNDPMDEIEYSLERVCNGVFIQYKIAFPKTQVLDMAAVCPGKSKHRNIAVEPVQSVDFSTYTLWNYTIYCL